ncbi:hypothetical protein CAEBREN_14704 [Caenorhabditis brenneri]|uniref:C-type lectin domain-containing protein n=1 Tax=Caenorhabditis brenneri TaxID=135651 RepID=G0NPB0_CAEBE|nr:hypothetical protein CAEBREN_14704 [Caenorhabditis brenneri]
MRLSALLCVFLVISSVFSQLPKKIVKFRGTMTVTDKFDSLFTSADKYTDDESSCLTKTACLGFYCLSPGKCRIFLRGYQLQATVHEAKDGDVSYIGIKAILPNNECPNSYEGFNYSVPDGLLNSWRQVSGVWKFESCKEEWERYERTTNGKIVCIKGLKLFPGVMKEQAQAECAALGAVLTGVASIEESEWMQGQVSEITGSRNSDYVFWLAGERQNPCTVGASIGYRTNIVWGDGIMNTERDAMTEKNCDISCVSNDGEDERCWGIMNYQEDGDKRIADVPCGGASYMQGAFCAYELYKE